MARRSMSILDVAAWLKATGERLVGLRLHNAYQLGDTLLLRFKGPGSEFLVIAEPSRRIHATRRVRPPSEARQTPLLALVKKHLRGRRVSEVSMLGGDRVIAVDFYGGGRLVVELVPRGVIALLDGEGRILAATRYVEMRDRTIRPRQPYKPPPPPSKNPLEPPSPELLRSALGGQRDIVRGLVRGLGLPGEAAEEAAYRAGLKGEASPSELEQRDLDALAFAVREILRESLEGRGFLAWGRGVSEATPFRPRRFEGSDVEVIEYTIIDEALDEHFHRLTGGGAEASAEAERLLESLRRAEETRRAYIEEASQLRRLAEAVARVYPELERVIACVEDARRSGGWDRASQCPGVTRIDPSHGVYVIEHPSLPGPLRVRVGESLDKVIVRLYAEAGEAEAKARRAEEALRDAEARLAELELRARARRAAEAARRRKREWYEKYHWIITRSGFLAIGGRDAGQNESIVRRYLDDRDVFMHADIHGAPAVILKTEGRQPGEGDLLDAAVIAAAYSKAWRAGLGSVRVYWVLGSQVSKSPPPGEYLARGAFMVYGRKNYLPPIPLRLALGLVLDPEGAPLVVVGPEDLVSKRSLAYAVLAPGDVKVEEASERIREALARVLPAAEKHLALGLPKEEVAQRLPGRSRILAVRRGYARLAAVADEEEGSG